MIQQLIVPLIIIVSSSVAKNTQFDKSPEEESKNREARFLRHFLHERKLPQTSFFLQGGEFFDKRKFANFLSLLNDKSKRYKKRGR